MPSIKTDSEKKILEAAKKVFFRRGLKGARMTDIAKEASITRASLNYYFRSKELLFKEVVVTGIKEVQEKIMHAAQGADMDLDGFITFLVSAITDTMRESPELSFFMIMSQQEASVAISDEIAKEVRPAHSLEDALSELIATEVKRGNIHPIEPEQLKLHIMSLCIFPFLDKQNIMKATGYDEQAMDRFYDDRKVLVTQLILRGLKKHNS